MVRDHSQRKESGAGRKKDILTDAQALVWTAWRGSARAAGQRIPEEDFTMAPRRAPYHRRAHTHAVISSMKHRRHQEATGEVAGSVASRGDFPSGI
jgi:hypothetical protein